MRPQADAVRPPAGGGVARGLAGAGRQDLRGRNKMRILQAGGASGANSMGTVRFFLMQTTSAASLRMLLPHELKLGFAVNSGIRRASILNRLRSSCREVFTWIVDVEGSRRQL